MLKRSKSFSLVLLAVLLAGFTGQEKFVELEGYLNGRSSSAFRAQDRNIKAVLSKGTRGEILSSKKMRSGNYGLRVRVMSGPETGKIFWVYYNVRNPDLALYDTAPQSWDEVSRETASVENAQGVETIRDTQAIDDTDKASMQAYNETKPQANAEVIEALQSVTEANAEVARVAIPASRPVECLDCRTEVQPTYEESFAATIGRASRPMSPRCDAFMNRNGQLGSMGKHAMGIMSESRYIGTFTKSNALGKFCPRFNELSTQEKLQAWTWFWGALANEETQCIRDINHGTHAVRHGRRIRINPRIGYGYYALEKDANVRASRGSACRDIVSGQGQIRCAIDIMKKTTLSQGQTASSDTLSYWGPVRRGGKQMMPHMKRFKACF